jgi:hypothetical protein
MHHTTHWLDEPRNVRRLWRGFLLLLVLSVLAGLVLPLHPNFEIEAVFAFNAWYGFMVCAAMIIVAKGVALVLKRPDNYYGKGDD